MSVVMVWAPNARKMELECNQKTLSMQEAGEGWWMLDTPVISHGVDYAFRVDGQGPFPDPRSGWQPDGVHGPSRWIDHSLFHWSDSGFQQSPLGSAVIYELHVGTFTSEGTFDGAVRRLDHLVDLGVTHVELMPVAEFSGHRGWGYDGADLYAPHHKYGGPDGLKRLVNECHQRGLAVLLDVVYNHLGPAGNYLSFFGPYFTERYSTPWGDAVNLDGRESDEVRRFFIDNARMWLRDYHIDGLRIDAVHALLDTSAVHILEQLSVEVEALEAELARKLVLIAESDLNDPRVIWPREVGGYGIDAQWNEDFHHALHALLTGENKGYYQDFGTLSDLAMVLNKGFAYDGRYSVYRKRSHGRPAAGLSGHKFIACFQNHDQVGNRAMGDRTSHLLSIGRLKIGAALVLTAPFIPMLFQGEEWGASTPFLYFTDHQEDQLGEAVRRGRQKEFAAFGWNPDDIPDPQAEQTFLDSKLNWDEMDQDPHASMIEWHRSLIRLRRSLPELTDGRMGQIRVHFEEQSGCLIMHRGRVSVACNFGSTAQNQQNSEFRKKEIVLSSEPGIRLEDDRIHLPSDSVAIMVSESVPGFIKGHAAHRTGQDA
jgi:maltooligosyltrehalose trehalohydrolase